MRQYTALIPLHKLVLCCLTRCDMMTGKYTGTVKSRNEVDMMHTCIALWRVTVHMHCYALRLRQSAAAYRTDGNA